MIFIKELKACKFKNRNYDTYSNEMKNYIKQLMLTHNFKFIILNSNFFKFLDIQKYCTLIPNCKREIMFKISKEYINLNNVKIKEFKKFCVTFIKEHFMKIKQFKTTLYKKQLETINKQKYNVRVISNIVAKKRRIARNVDNTAVMLNINLKQRKKDLSVSVKQYVPDIKPFYHVGEIDINKVCQHRLQSTTKYLKTIDKFTETNLNLVLQNPWSIKEENYDLIPKDLLLPGFISVNVHGGFTYRPFIRERHCFINFVRCYGVNKQSFIQIYKIFHDEQKLLQLKQIQQVLNFFQQAFPNYFEVPQSIDEIKQMVSNGSSQTNVLTGLQIEEHKELNLILKNKIYNIDNLNNMLGKDTKFKNCCLSIKKLPNNKFQIIYPSKYVIVGKKLKRAKFKTEENIFTTIIFTSGKINLLGKHIPKDINIFLQWFKQILECPKHEFLYNSSKRSLVKPTQFLEDKYDAYCRGVTKFPKQNIYTQCFCTTCKFIEQSYTPKINYMKKAFCLTCNKKNKTAIHFKHVEENYDHYCKYGHPLKIVNSYPWYVINKNKHAYDHIGENTIYHMKNRGRPCGCITCLLKPSTVKQSVLYYCPHCIKEDNTKICHYSDNLQFFCHTHNIFFEKLLYKFEFYL